MSAKYPVRKGYLRSTPSDKFVPLVDSLTGQTYLARVNRQGELTRARAHSGMDNYTEEQYGLIMWAIWKRYHGWSCKEIAVIVRQFWKLEPGQPPWINRFVVTWWALHQSNLKKGRIWPS